jgi:putative hemolysin
MNSASELKTALIEKLKANKAKMNRTMNRAEKRLLAALIAPIPQEKVLSELAARAEVLYDSSPEKPEKGLKIYCAKGVDIPDVLLELGRLREETFRTVGEGSGLSHDNDAFDMHYLHLIAWDKKANTITGAYRLGQLDKILGKQGPSGVYTNQLFDLGELLKSDFREGTLEAGRSFVRPEYQRGPSLFAIWIGMARLIVKNPRYKNLMGPVSISNEFQENSKHLLVHYLMKKFPHTKSPLVRSKNPPQFDSQLTPEELTLIVDEALDLSALQEFVRCAEDNPKAQIPQLIKLYLDLGVRFLAFNKDNDFNTIDGLIWTDITELPFQVLERYMGTDGARSYLSFHGKI